MMLYNIKQPKECVDFKTAVTQGIGSDGGLFFPENLPHFKNIPQLLQKSFVNRSVDIAQQMLMGDLPNEVIKKIVEDAFNFPIKVHQVEERIFALELFWGPTLAFKDFGARFMAKTLAAITQEPITIVTATSGDTGAAVAHAFYDIPNIKVAILYPYQKISQLQEKLFCTLGKNIHTFAVQGDFDACQTLVKQCFSDENLGFSLNSANSINISRVFAQTLYYFEALAQTGLDKETVISVPSGNFGNLTAGLFARSMGLPVSHFVAATNANDTIPRYLSTGKWEPHSTQATLSNAMDVSQPNNWPRIEELMRQKQWNINDTIKSESYTDEQTKKTMQYLQKLNYIADPHSAIAYAGLKAHLKPHQNGVFLCTAHPAKFKDSVDQILNIDIPLPTAIADTIDKPLLSKIIANDYSVFSTNLKTIAAL